MLLVFLTIIMIAVAVPFVIRSFLWNRVLKLLHNGQYDKVLIMLNSKAFQLFFKEYDRNWNTLRVYLAQGNNRKIEEQTKKLLDSRLTNAQAYQIASQTYFCLLYTSFMTVNDLFSVHTVSFGVEVVNRAVDGLPFADNRMPVCIQVEASAFVKQP